MKKKLCILIGFLLVSFQFLSAQKKIIAGLQNKDIVPFQPPALMQNCDTIFSFPANVSWPSGLTFDGTYFYVSDFNTPYIYKYDISGTPAGTIPNPATGSDYGGDLDFDGTYLWLVVEDDGTIFKLDAVSGAVLLQYNLPTSNITDPDDFGCAWDNGFIWITEYIDQTLMRIDPSSGTVIDSFEINRTILPLKIINNNLYGIELSGPSGNQLLHFNKSNGIVIDSMPWCLDYPLGLCSANNHLWGLSSFVTNRVFEFDTLLFTGENEIVAGGNFSICPNPVKEKLTLSLSLKKASDIQIEIYNCINQRIKTVLHQAQLAGKHKIEIDLKEIPQGIYFLRCVAGETSGIKKIIKLK